MKRLILAIFILFHFFLSFSQSWKSDTVFVNHWNRKPSSCMYFFKNEKFVGFLLKWKILKETDIFLSNLFKYLPDFPIDTSASQIEIDTTTVLLFETQLRDTINKNKYLLLPNPSYLDLSYYIRQYVGLCFNNNKYLLVSFQIDEENVQIKEDKYFLDSLNTRSYDLYKLIYTKIFKHPTIQHWSRINDLFYILYNIDTQKMEFYFMVYVIKEE